ncbi:unnamed protein product [Rhodiola kirilowii]
MRNFVQAQDTLPQLQPSASLRCMHYRRRCMIRAPCCNEIYDCRHCHNEATSLLPNPMDHHDLVWQDVKQD